MTPQAHFFFGWMVGQGSGAFSRRNYGLVVTASLAPDLDGMGYPFEYVTAGTAHALQWYTQYHHALFHSVLYVPVIGGLAWWISKDKVTAGLCMLAFLSHLIMDLIGSGGPQGDAWPIVPFYPLSQWEYAVAWQWPLHSPINSLIVLAFELIMIALAWKRGFSPLSLISTALDRRVFAIFHRRSQVSTARLPHAHDPNQRSKE